MIAGRTSAACSGQEAIASVATSTPPYRDPLPAASPAFSIRHSTLRSLNFLPCWSRHVCNAYENAVGCQFDWGTTPHTVKLIYSYNRQVGQVM